MKRKEYFKQSFWNTFKSIVPIVIFILMMCLCFGIVYGILYFIAHCVAPETVNLIVSTVVTIIIIYYIIKYGLMLIFNIYHFFVCLYLVDELNDRQFALYKKYIYGDKYGVFLGERNADVTKYLKKFNPIRYRKYKDILERPEEQDG